MFDEAAKILVKQVLQDPFDWDVYGEARREWTVQGFGMLRTYLDGDHVWRLNIWDDRFRVPNVSMIHNHPWHFQSAILAGVVEQYRYEYSDTFGSESFWRQTIRTGEGGGLVEDDKMLVNLRRQEPEIYRERGLYSQVAAEIHISLPVNGTVTLNKRTPVNDASHAYVFWPLSEEWVTAEPRPATQDEIFDITTASLDGWFSGD